MKDEATRVIAVYADEDLEPPRPRCACGKQANHYFGDDTGMCCRCYVLDGHPPADWHIECMTTYRKNGPKTT